MGRNVSWTERLVYVALLCVTGDVRPRPPSTDSVARDIVAMVDANDLDSLPSRLSDGATHTHSLERVRARAEDMRARYGPSTRIEPFVQTYEGELFWVEAERGAWLLWLELDDQGDIDAIQIEPELERSAPLGLPVRGEWRVGAAGPTRISNHHAHAPAQRRAADLVVVDASERLYQGEGTRNEDFHAYGRDVVAMAEGVVRVAVDGVHENVPGHKQGQFGPGNMVLVEHADGLFGFYCHFIPGTVAVEPGEHVQRGQLLGNCGNSGHSGGPHLHVHAQDRPTLVGAWGIELVFDEVWRTRYGKRKRVEDYAFHRSDIVAPGASQ